MYKYTIKISFPLGAKFHNNVHLLVYKSFLKMIKKLSCINIESKCKDCSLCKSCQYYNITGHNFHNYPGIVFKQDKFAKSLYRDNDECVFYIYLIGNIEKFKSYVEIFFLEYLQHKIAGYPFQIKSIDKGYVKNELINLNKLKIVSIFENKNFIEGYNQMIDFYNQSFGTSYSKLESNITIENLKNIHQQEITLNTYKLSLNGFVFNVYGEFSIPEEIIEIGIGKYNFVGGGQIAIEN